MLLLIQQITIEWLLHGNYCDQHRAERRRRQDSYPSGPHVVQCERQGPIADQTLGQEQHKDRVLGNTKEKVMASAVRKIFLEGSVWSASWGMAVDGKRVRGVFSLGKEHTSEWMLSKGIIYLVMGELGVPGAQGVCGGSKWRLWGLRMLRSLNMSVRQRGSQSRFNWFQEVHSASSVEDILESCS